MRHFVLAPITHIKADGYEIFTILHSYFWLIWTNMWYKMLDDLDKECTQLALFLFLSESICGYPLVHVTYLHGIHRHSSQIVRVLFVPAQSQKGVMLWVFIDNGGMF